MKALFSFGHEQQFCQQRFDQRMRNYPQCTTAHPAKSRFHKAQIVHISRELAVWNGEQVKIGRLPAQTWNGWHVFSAVNLHSINVICQIW